MRSNCSNEKKKKNKKRPINEKRKLKNNQLTVGMNDVYATHDIPGHFETKYRSLKEQKHDN